MGVANGRSERSLGIWNAFIDSTYPVLRSLPEPSVPPHPEYSVVVIEPRKHPHLEYSIRNALHFLGPAWGLELYVGNRNESFVRDLTGNWGDVRISRLGVDDLNTRSYNQLKKSRDFWESVAAEHVLWLEPDCVLCRKGIEDYLEFDYIGAPWPKNLALSPNCRVGNGGLSLRRKSAMLEIAGAANPDAGLFLAEDMFFCVNMTLCNLQQPNTFRLPTLEQASEFAVEGVFNPRPLGLHKVWKYLRPDQVVQLVSQIDYVT